MGLYARVAYVLRARVLQEFYFFAVTRVTLWEKWMAIIDVKLCEKRAERNGKTPQNSWIEGCSVKTCFVLCFVL